MKSIFGITLIFTVCFALLAASSEDKSPKPQYDQKGNLLRPTDYRDWEFLSAGYGMNYSPVPAATKWSPKGSCRAGPNRGFEVLENGPNRPCLESSSATRRGNAPSIKPDIFRPI